MSFSQQTVVITGASDGIGAAIARHLASEGAWLVLGARRAAELEDVAKDCVARGARAIAVPCDVTDPDQCRSLVDRARAEYGKIDMLMNNAGIGGHFQFRDVTDLSVFDRIMRVNYLGTVYCTHFALPALMESRGRLVAISSLAGKVGVPDRTAYAASKHAVQGFFDSLRIELDGTGVSVTVVSPGFVATGLRRAALDANGNAREAGPQKGDVMSADECARITLDAARRRAREKVMYPNWRLISAVGLFAPNLVDARSRKKAESSRGP